LRPGAATVWRALDPGKGIPGLQSQSKLRARRMSFMSA
jgi:hypothetical protein